jgi:hypothetical protein
MARDLLKVPRPIPCVTGPDGKGQPLPAETASSMRVSLELVWG